MSVQTVGNRAFSTGASELLTAADISVGQKLQSSTSSYSILEFIGEGSFGKVAKCENTCTHEIVAIKMLKDSAAITDAKKEVFILELLSVLDPKKANLVKFYESFEHCGLTCLTFEMLDTSLLQALKNRNLEPLSVGEIRPIAQQLLVALDALKSMKMIHTDIKPDNIMFMDLQHQPLRVKLIDFGLALPTAHVKDGMWLQPLGYRAPEVTLGIPFNEAIDVWGVGCTLAFLYLGKHLFPHRCIYQMMKKMVEILGFPQEHLLQMGHYTNCFFTKTQSEDFWTPWRLLTPEEFAAVTKLTPEFYYPSDGIYSLDDLVKTRPRVESAEYDDRKAFVELLKGLLTFNGNKRWTPSQALEHNFFTLSHLRAAPDSEDYLRISADLMSLCPEGGTSKDTSGESQNQHCPNGEEQARTSLDSGEVLKKTTLGLSQDEACPTSACDEAPDSEVHSPVLSVVTHSSVPKVLLEEKVSHTSASEETKVPDSGFQSLGVSSEMVGPRWDRERPLVSSSHKETGQDTEAQAHVVSSEKTTAATECVMEEAFPTRASNKAPDSEVCFSQMSLHKPVPVSHSSAFEASTSPGAPSPSTAVVGEGPSSKLSIPTKRGAKVSNSRGAKRIRSFFRRLLETFCCCVNPKVDH